MTEKEMSFIMCVNNDVFAEECIYYINQLIIPENYSIDILTVTDAKSMTAGYNEAMKCSKAKYKVYMHQDVFIINPYFIRDVLDVFQQDAQIGMIGMIGSPRLPESGIMWREERVGTVYDCHVDEVFSLPYSCQKPVEVMAADGLMLITQYDIPWREDLFDKWDFYDCSQSMEFRRHGYKVVVPGLKEPWVVHDDGYLNFMNFERERKKFVREYLENDCG